MGSIVIYDGSSNTSVLFTDQKIEYYIAYNYDLGRDIITPPHNNYCQVSFSYTMNTSSQIALSSLPVFHDAMNVNSNDAPPSPLEDGEIIIKEEAPLSTSFVSNDTAPLQLEKMKKKKEGEEIASSLSTTGQSLDVPKIALTVNNKKSVRRVITLRGSKDDQISIPSPRPQSVHIPKSEVLELRRIIRSIGVLLFENAEKNNIVIKTHRVSIIDNTQGSLYIGTAKHDQFETRLSILPSKKLEISIFSLNTQGIPLLLETNVFCESVFKNKHNEIMISISDSLLLYFIKLCRMICPKMSEYHNVPFQPATAILPYPFRPPQPV
jgi:hypothetical protein